MSVLSLSAARLSVAVGGYEIGSGRLVPALAAVVGVCSVVVGGFALARSGRTGAGRVMTVMAVVALVAGLVAVVVGGLHTANSAGGLGTGNGLAGAVVAAVLGLVGTVVGGMALARLRHP